MANTVFNRRLEKFGLRDPGEAYREEVRVRIKRVDPKKSRPAAMEEAEYAMQQLFEPALKKIEAMIDQGERALTGLPDDLSDALDPEYSKVDQGEQLRDGLIWAALEWARIITDSEDGPIANLENASCPPPNAFAIFILEEYATGSKEKRKELINKAIGLATKDAPKATKTAEPAKDEKGESFLDKIT
jgi:hypothetical protein